MSVESFDPSSQVVTVSPSALAHFRRQLSSEQGKSVRLSVKKSGCTGFMYAIDLVEKAGASDLHYQLDEQVELLIDSSSLQVLSGTQIDLVREGVNQQIRFINPNVKDECGCGESFSVN
ncbi:MAG TPA: iron-sulfur cluster assembly accessory protein [Pseudomonas sabulinigri]|jgi:iron-sulfur cluster assembly accessory protein|uniref:Core domain-containing protein n=1 Tax=marine sediment metagenome TaxID=412755 RepID=A0A0F9S5T2_9ZZZZ|nr:iron-sulfur cluster assembly accessory protein [Halopseudomonas sabulinigri]HEC53140.1 iron-sulfur cluster assembly accessory protein [Halopseudomonas sabulinigri]|tara:strand:+ start:2637 stop:2993 length:357 start_codon:yes stop_codon:yes gene_type:complete